MNTIQENTLLAIKKQEVTGRLALENLIRSQAITSYFQPIVELHHGSVTGFELLSRATHPFDDTKQLFDLARDYKLGYLLEKTCLRLALKAISKLPDALKELRFFINLSPDSFLDRGIIREFSDERLRNLGLKSSNLVIEITEDYQLMGSDEESEMIAMYKDAGFNLALDDFGTGYSSFISLCSLAPHYIKLDRSIVSGVKDNLYLQRLIRAIVTFAQGVSSNIIAEGLEDWEDLEVLIRLGVTHAQGYLFQIPDRVARLINDETRTKLRSCVDGLTMADQYGDDSISPMVVSTDAKHAHSMNCAQLDRFFKQYHDADHLTVLENNKPVGLITRQQFYISTGGQFGYHLFANKPIEEVSKNHTLVVNERTSITKLATLAMNRIHEDVYDPIIVVNDSGNFLGTITIRQLLQRASDLSIREARDLNPLTGLPGNHSIDRWISEAIQNRQFTVIYADLDHFKAYNDRYGFMQGDQVIQMTARLLQHREFTRLRCKTGHVGGDDFVLVSLEHIDDCYLDQICSEFDKQRESKYTSDAVNKGFFSTINRNGSSEKVLLTSLSLAVIDGYRFTENLHPAMLVQIAASLKKKIKAINYETGRSGWLREKRNY